MLVSRLGPAHMIASPSRPQCMVAWNAVAFQFWATYLAQRLRVRRYGPAAAGAVRYQPNGSAKILYPLQSVTTSLLLRRVRTLSPLVSPWHCTACHLVHDLLTRCSATDKALVSKKGGEVGKVCNGPVHTGPRGAGEGRQTWRRPSCGGLKDW